MKKEQKAIKETFGQNKKSAVVFPSEKNLIFDFFLAIFSKVSGQSKKKSKKIFNKLF
ncbi:hypothetical protein ABE930_19015 [Enterococcus raffinosus]|uniref:hypothetical protein n=1 Tax=Enterococcus raffinosus TaxID=71452 RepID=UPI00226D92CA|nr:hypothetical protein [Enterococcus faecium]